MSRNPFLIAALVAPLALSPGCGGGGNEVRVAGKLLKGGAKYTPPEGHLMTMTFIALEVRDRSGKSVANNEPYVANLDIGEGTFQVPGREGYGIPPGKYRIAVTQRMSREAFEADKPKAKPGRPPVTRETDFLDGKFSPESSPIVREVKGSTDLTIDLDNPAGS